MNIFFARLLVISGFVIGLGLAACASHSGSLQSRIEHKIENPEDENVKIGAAHYNAFSTNFEEPWPFGPYSN